MPDFAFITTKSDTWYICHDNELEYKPDRIEFKGHALHMSGSRIGEPISVVLPFVEVKTIEMRPFESRELIYDFSTTTSDWDNFLAERKQSDEIKDPFLFRTTMPRQEIRHMINQGAKLFFNTIRNDVLQKIAGELMSKNEEYVLLNFETQGARMILEQGFTVNQKNWLKELDKELVKNVR